MAVFEGYIVIFSSISYKLPPVANVFYFIREHRTKHHQIKRKYCTKYKFHKCDVLNKVVRAKIFILYYFILFYFILFHFISFYFILFLFFLFLLFYLILFYFVLFYFILFSFNLFCFIQFYFIFMLCLQLQCHHNILF